MTYKISKKILLLGGILAFTPHSADAMDVYNSTPKYNDYDVDLGNYVRNATTKPSIDRYYYSGHRLKLGYVFQPTADDYNKLQKWIIDGTVSKNNNNGTITLECSSSPKSNGGWTVSTSGDMTCWNAMYASNVYYQGNLLNSGNSVQIIGEQPLTTDNITVTPLTSQCNASHYSSPTNKKVCIDGSGVTVNTNDDMISIAPKAGAYIEYDLLGNRNLSGLGSNTAMNKRLQYIHSSRDSDAGNLVMPSGYTASNVETAPDITEYYTFGNSNFVSSGSNNVSLVNGCYEAKVGICENVAFTGTDQYIDGSCGVANGQGYMNTSEISKTQLCKGGVPTSISTTADGKTFKWTCQGVGYSASASKLASDASCQAYYDVNAKCGTSNGDYFDTKTDLLNKGQLCASNSNMSSMIGSETGPWIWECASKYNTTTATCTGLPSTKDCSDLLKDQRLVVVQDLSGSFVDDLNNTRSAFNALFRNSLFVNWGVGLTSFVDGTDFTNHGGYFILPTQLSSVLSVYNGMRASGGGDFPENQVYAMSRAIDVYGGRSNQQLTLVLATDATAHEYVSFSALVSKMKSSGVKAITLSTGQSSYYSGHFSSAGGSGITTHLEITSNSDNLGQNLMQALLNLNCK